MRVYIINPCHVAHVLRQRGDAVEVESDVGTRLVAAGYGSLELVQDRTPDPPSPDSAETKTLSAPEQAAYTRRQRRR